MPQWCFIWRIIYEITGKVNTKHCREIVPQTGKESGFFWGNDLRYYRFTRQYEGNPSFFPLTNKIILDY
jgi:hypothetical protein